MRYDENWKEKVETIPMVVWSVFFIGSLVLLLEFYALSFLFAAIVSVFIGFIFKYISIIALLVWIIKMDAPYENN